MTDLHTLLEHSVDHPVDLDTAADLRRGQVALRRRRRIAVTGVAAAVLAVGAAATAATRPAALHLEPADDGPATISAGAFEIAPPPSGWRVEGADRTHVVIARDEEPLVDLQHPHLVLRVGDKMVISLVDGTLESPRSGPTIEYDGRDFYDNETSPARQVGVEESPHIWLVLQEAPQLHWTVQHMIEYLDAVVVTSDAVPQT